MNLKEMQNRFITMNISKSFKKIALQQAFPLKKGTQCMLAHSPFYNQHIKRQVLKGVKGMNDKIKEAVRSTFPPPTRLPLSL